MDMKPNAALGPISDWTVPQSWFGHFYAIGALWNIFTASLFIASPYFSTLEPPLQTVYITALALLEFHLVRRLLETLGLMKYPQGARMHGIAYIFGVSYYLVVPLSVLPDEAFVSMARTFGTSGFRVVAEAVAVEKAARSVELLSAMNIAVR